MDSGPPLLRAIVGAWVLLVGAAVGSFLNVVIARLPRGESVVRPRSRCPRCGAPIAWYDNIPVLSWIVLRARCRRCGARIPARYPLVEALGAAAAWLAWSRHGLAPAAAAELAFAAALVALAFIDVEAWLLPHAITWPLLAAGLALSALGLTGAAGLRASAYGAGVGFAAFALVALVGERVFRREALGFGDVWLLAGIGAWLGLAALLPVVLFASVQGSLVGIGLVLAGKGTPGPPEPTSTASGTPIPPPISTPPPIPTSTSGPVPTPPPMPVPAPARADQEWIPPRNAVPFGPFLAAAALEWLYLAEPLSRAVPVLHVFR